MTLDPKNYDPALMQGATLNSAQLTDGTIVNADIADSTIAGAKLTAGKGYFTVTTSTNGTTAVNVFGAGGAPTALTLTGAYVVSKDTTAGNITVKQAANTVCTIAKGTAASALVGATILANTAYAASDVCTVESSAAAGNAFVMLTFTVV